MSDTRTSAERKFANSGYWFFGSLVFAMLCALIATIPPSTTRTFGIVFEAWMSLLYLGIGFVEWVLS